MNAVGSRRWWALIAVGLAMLAVGMDMTGLNVALPTLAGALHAGTSGLQWVLDAYLLVMAAGILPAGLAGDRFGQKRLIIGGLVIFGAGSAWCAWAGSASELIAARAVLGLGAAVLTPLAISLVAVLFEPGERQRAIGLMSIFSMIGIPLGPILAGLLLQHFWWGSIFVINLPAAAIALLAVIALVPGSRGQRGRRLDWPGILASGIGMVGITFGLIESQQDGWDSAPVLTSLLVGGAALGALVFWERRTTHPMLDVSLFSKRDFTSGTVLATVVSLVLFGALFVLPQFLQAVQGADALGTGLRTLPLVAGVMVGFQTANRVASRLGPIPVMLTGLGITAAGAVIGAVTTAGTGYALIAAWSAIFGLGVGLALVTAMTTATNPLSKDRAGIGSSMLMSARQFGSVIGTALLGTILAAGYRSGLHLAGLPAPAAHATQESAAAGTAVAARLHSPGLLSNVRVAFSHGMDLTLWVTAGVAVAGLLLGLGMTLRQRRTPQNTEPDAAEPAVPVPASAPEPIGDNDNDAPSLVYGRVYAAGGPTAQAALTLVDATGHQVDATHTEADGSYRLAAPEAGTYLLTCLPAPALAEAPSPPRADWVTTSGVPTSHDIA
jgi:EmrB/QacA subfamily drug resistance transporter